MPNKYRQDADVHLIPYHEYDPSIHNIEYRYLQQPTEESFAYPNTYDASAADTRDFYRRPVYRPHPMYPGGFYHPPVYGGFGGYHPFGFPYGGFPGYGYHGGYHPYGGGYYHHDSSSR